MASERQREKEDTPIWNACTHTYCIHTKADVNANTPKNKHINAHTNASTGIHSNTHTHTHTHTHVLTNDNIIVDFTSIYLYQRNL